MSHYEQELARIPTDGKYAAKFQFRGGGGDDPAPVSHWMDLNPESAEALRDWLESRFPRTRQTGVGEVRIIGKDQLGNWIGEQPGIGGVLTWDANGKCLDHDGDLHDFVD